jgi:lysophospholipase L1-like esterase
MYDHPDAPNYASFAAAARAGNPDSIVAFNPGVFNPVVVLSAEQDYVAGEINDPQVVQCEGRWVDGVQFQMLTYLGASWAQSPPRFSAPQVAAITRRVVEKEGVVTWDVPIQPNGTIPQSAIDAMSSLQHELPLPKPAAAGVRINPLVVDGLDVTPRDGGVTVSPGTVTVDGKPVTVAGPTEIDVAPARVISVRDEATTLSSDEPGSYGNGTGLAGCLSIGTSLHGCLVPDSLVVKAAPGPDAQRFDEGKDWRADKAWGRIGRLPDGAIGADTTVYIDYDYSLLRLDLIEVLSSGDVVLRRGADHKMIPQRPLTDSNAAALCSIFMPYGATAVAAEQIYPIGEAYPAPRAEDIAQYSSYIAKSREKLEAGGPFTLLFWGDSVTCGGDTSTPDHAFPQAFTAWLRNKYPQAQITYVNAGTGGWNSDSKLPLFQEEVIDKKPDLVVIEFVNDMGMDRGRIFENYTQAVTRIRDIGGEVIIVTPHFVMPIWMPVQDMRTAETRTAVTYLREFAITNHIPLADTSRRWEHLWREGLPYITLLYNGINHPDDRGHWLFVEELQRLFP